MRQLETLPALVAQRVYGLAPGYEDLNDHDVLRKDSVLALLVGKHDLTGEARVREQDRGNPLAASSTLDRLQLSTPGAAPADRYKKIAADPGLASIPRVAPIARSTVRWPSVG
jgi:hypothetical protein